MPSIPMLPIFARLRTLVYGDKSLHLCWVFHQAGDIQQPLHPVAWFSKALPEGDRGGNGVTVPRER